jgi:hypothetical protein
MKTIFSLRRQHYITRAGTFLIMVALVVGMAGCANRPARDAIEIRDWYDLSAIANNMSADYVLENDLDATTDGWEELASPTANEGKGWEPLGPDWPNFVGLFDGQGYEIRDLFINRPDEERVGLFSQTTTFAVIRNVGVVNANVTGYAVVGGLLGIHWGGTVINCYFSGSVTGTGDYRVGGLVGSNSNLGTVSDCYSTGSVSGDSLVGGLTGWNDGIVENCYFDGNVIGKGRVGGLIGRSNGDVSGSYSTGNVTGTSSVGGLVGWNGYGASVSDSYSTGRVSGADCCNGGLVGVTEGSVSDSYSTGGVTGNNSGGLVGQNRASGAGAVSNSFWDTETGGLSFSGDGWRGTGKNTTEMQDIATFTDTETEGLDEPWNITAVANPDIRNPSYIWNVVDDETYPFLSWQPVT